MARRRLILSPSSSYSHHDYGEEEEEDTRIQKDRKISSIQSNDYDVREQGVDYSNDDDRERPANYSDDDDDRERRYRDDDDDNERRVNYRDDDDDRERRVDYSDNDDDRERRVDYSDNDDDRERGVDYSDDDDDRERGVDYDTEEDRRSRGSDEEEEEEEEEVNVVAEEKSVENHGNHHIVCGKRKQREDTNSISLTLTNPNLLDCPVCLLPFTIPVFQCDNGHAACSSCCSKLRNKCPSCSFPIGSTRCRAIENFLQAVIISCRNMKYGCKETVSYNKKLEHEQTCIHEPCLCPHPGCDFVGSSKQLYLHFDCKHLGSATGFYCDSLFSVTLKPDTEFVILQEHFDNHLLILNHGIQRIGYVVNITCIGPSSSSKMFSYEIIARKGDSSVTLKSFAENIPRWSQHVPQKEFLMVPTDFLDSSEHHFQVCIRRNKQVRNRTPTT